VLLAPILRRRRRRPAGRSAAAVLDAWQQGLAPVRWATGLRPRAAETHDEFSRRAAAPLGALAPPLRELAGLATTAAWDPAGASPAAADRAGALADELADQVRATQSRPARLRRRLSWREAFGRPRPAARPDLTLTGLSRGGPRGRWRSRRRRCRAGPCGP